MIRLPRGRFESDHGSAPAASVAAMSGTDYIFGFPQPTNGLVQIAWSPVAGIKDLAAAPRGLLLSLGLLILLLAVVRAADAPVVCETADEGRRADIAFLRGNL